MLRPMPIEPIPPQTARVARAAFPKGNRYLRLADELDTLFTDEAFGALFPPHGQPACSPWRLALVTILQFAEGLSDRQAAHAVRSRIDWKYVLRLELTDPGFDASVLSEFRTCLITGAAEALLLEMLLTWCRERQLIKARGRQRTDSTHILAAVRALNRIEVVGETLRHALNSLAVVAPEWLRAVSPPAWRDRYARRAEDDRLPATQAARTALILTIGCEGWQLLAAIDHADTPRWVREVHAVAVLRRVWMQNYWWDGTQLRWREADNIPPAGQFVSSPYDLEAHYARKHTTQQPSPRHPLPLCGINSTVFGKYLLNQPPEPHGASSRALHARESTYVNPIGCVAPTRSASFPTEVNNVLTRFATQWVGYKVHITETCEDDLPHLITHIETTPGPASDGAATPKIHAALEQRGLLPGTHIVDTGFLDADLFVESRDDYGVDLLGPTRLDDHWQAREGAGFDVQHFQIDWDRQHARCPVGKTSISWTPAMDNRGNAVIKVKFSSKDCRRCDHVTQCIRSQKRYPRRTLTIRPQPQYQALQAARQREATAAFQAEYARRAGIEGTISRETRSLRLRRTRYIGHRRVHLGHILAAVGLNVLRLGEWLLEMARAKTRITPFARLMADAA